MYRTSSPSYSAPKLLLIEDNNEVVTSLTKLLSEYSRHTFLVSAANTLAEGLRVLQSTGIDVIVLDLSLPDSSGRETFHTLRRAAPHLPVIILSGTQDEDLAVGLVQEGAQDYFVKGEGDIHLLPRALRYAIERNRAEQALAAERNLLRNVINSIPDIIYVRDLARRCIVENTAHASALQCGGHGAATLLEEDGSDDECVLSRAQPVLNRVCAVNVAPAAEVQWFSTSKVPLLDRDGTVIGLVGSLRDITEQKRAEEGLRASEQQLHALAARLQTVREEDRVRIARELHDHIGQDLTVLKMELCALASNPDRADDSVRLKALSLADLVTDTLRAIREICADLRPQMLDDLGLVATLEWHAQQFQKRWAIPCNVAASGHIALDPERTVAVYRVVQEALTNIVRHAGASSIEVVLAAKDGILNVIVRDNGRGITQEQIAQRQSLGLLGMRERVQGFGGEFTISGKRGKGTTITVRMPLAER